MADKLDFYDIIAIIVPGVLTLSAVPILFPAVAFNARSPGFPDAFTVIVLTALAVLVGHLVQGIGSLIEPLLTWSWGGRPSDIALTHGLGPRYLPPDTAQRIRGILEAHLPEDSARTDRSMFLFAVSLANGSNGARHQRLNAIYAYHRGVLVLLGIIILLLLLSMYFGAARDWPVSLNVLLLVVLALLSILTWHRTKQWRFYYMREVLLRAEQTIRDRSASGTPP